MHIRFQRFTGLSSTADDQVAFTEAMSAAADDFDLTFFACPILPQQDGLAPLAISTSPSKRTADYLHSHYERLDPVITQALHDTEPFRWGFGLIARQLSSAQHELFTKLPSLEF